MLLVKDVEFTNPVTRPLFVSSIRLEGRAGELEYVTAIALALTFIHMGRIWNPIVKVVSEGWEINDVGGEGVNWNVMLVGDRESCAPLLYDKVDVTEYVFKV